MTDESLSGLTVVEIPLPTLPRLIVVRAQIHFFRFFTLNIILLVPSYFIKLVYAPPSSVSAIL